MIMKKKLEKRNKPLKNQRESSKTLYNTRKTGNSIRTFGKLTATRNRNTKKYLP